MSFLELLMAAAEDGTTLVSSNTATSVIPPNRKKAIAANFYDALPKLIELHAWGKISTLGAAPGNLTFDVRYGSSPVIVWNGGASRTLPTSLANAAWKLFIHLAASSLTFSGATPQCTLRGYGELLIENQLPFIFPVTSPGVAGTAFDPTASQPVDLFATFSANSASNSLTVNGFDLRTPSAS